MAATIFYFTGTGNSLAAARRIGESLGDCTLIPIASIVGQKTSGTGVTGLVFPLYFCGLPEIVSRFTRQLELDQSEYTFAVVTRGGGPSRALTQLRQIFAGKGLKLDAGFLVNMPGNYTPLRDVLPQEKLKKVLTDAGNKLDEISEMVSRRESSIDRENPLSRLIGREIYHYVIDTLNTRDEKFHLTEGCTSCGICAEVCPVGNITMEAGHPEWHGNCQQCFACHHFCIEQVIQFGRKTAQRGRYHHPEIRYDDISRQRIGIAEHY